MRYDIVTIGEVLIDLTQTGIANGIPQYAANPGGAPANAAVAAARMGCCTAFIGRVGADAFGAQLRAVLEREGIDIQGLSTDPEVPTTLAVVSVDEKGERSFSFYRKPGADLCLTQSDIPTTTLKNTRFLHFGSVSLTADPARSAVLEAVTYAKARGVAISYDPNYRASLWPDEDTARKWMRRGLELADVVKISDEETELLTDTSDPAQAADRLFRGGRKLVLVTLGAEGVYYHHSSGYGIIPGFAVKVADTNGTGDTFLGATLAGLCRTEKPLEDLTAKELEEVLRFANRAASLTASRPGAIPAIPTCDEVEASL